MLRLKTHKNLLFQFILIDDIKFILYEKMLIYTISSISGFMILLRNSVMCNI